MEGGEKEEGSILSCKSTDWKWTCQHFYWPSALP